MQVKAFVLAVGLLSVVHVSAAQAQTAPQGDPGKGRAMFYGQGGSGLCMLCHGRNAEGAFGPDLAGGRGLTFDQFKRAVHQPWGVMPKYPAINDEGLANIYAFLKSLPPAAKPGAWGVEPPPAGAPNGQALAIQFGCGQCHGPEMGHPRRDIGGKGIDYAEFQKIVYEHGPGQMGLFSRERLPEPIVKELWDFMKTAGFRPLVFGQIAAGVPSGANTTYTITVENKGVPGKGMAAEDLLLSLVVPQGLTVAAGTGPGYQGVTKSVDHYPNPGRLSPFSNPNPDLTRVKGDFATWKFSKLPVGEKQTFTITLSGPGADKANFTGTTVTWGKPDIRRIPGLVMKDQRLADKGDIIYAPSLEFFLPPPPKPTSSQN